MLDGMVKSLRKSKKKTHKAHKNQILFRSFNYVPIGHKKFDKQKKIISKGLLKTSSNFDLSKVHNYHLIKVSPKTISHLPFMISFFNPCLATINNLEWSSI
jgi:hypothetical protein